jgi:hypothetical protein
MCTEAGWPNPVSGVAGGIGFVPPTGCGACSCTLNASCPTTADVLEYGNGCTGGSTADMVSTACTMTTMSTDGLKGSPTVVVGAKCTGITPTPTSMPHFGTLALGCSPAPAPACPGGQCVEPANHLCVWAAGMQPCPMGYPTQRLVYGGIQNTYACTQCQCMVASTPTCMPSVSVFQDFLCASALGSVVLDGTSCFHVGVLAQSMVITNVGTPMGGMCSITGGGVLTGNATGTNPVTVCCTN